MVEFRVWCFHDVTFTAAVTSGRKISSNFCLMRVQDGTVIVSPVAVKVYERGLESTNSSNAEDF